MTGKHHGHASTAPRIELNCGKGGSEPAAASSSSSRSLYLQCWPMIRQVQWSAAAAAGLSRALQGRTLAYVAREVQTGIAQLWRCQSADHEAYCVTRIDENPLTLVIVAFEGSGMLHFAPAFIQAARSRGLRLRAHTMSEQLARVLQRRLRWKHLEFVVCDDGVP